MKGLKLNMTKAYGDCTGPLGFPMRSDVAKHVEGLLRELPDECKEITTDIVMDDGSTQTIAGYGRKVVVPKKFDFDENERADVSLITTNAVDRDFEVILPTGCDFKQFKANPVVPFAHNYKSLPVGRCLWVKRQRPSRGEKGADGWLAKTQYISKPDDWGTDWFPDAVMHYVKAQVLRGKSIGFIPLKLHRPIPAEVDKRPELEKVHWIIDESLVLEYSVCSVQSNPDALVVQVAKMKSAGVGVPDAILDELGLILPDEPEPFKAADLVDDPPPARKARRLTDAERRAHVKTLAAKAVGKLDMKKIIRDAMDVSLGKV